MGRPATDKATKREIDILRMINNHIEKYGFPPTRSEICKYFDFTSSNSASCFVNSLAKKDYLTLYTEVSRGLQITEKGKQELEGEL